MSEWVCVWRWKNGVSDWLNDRLSRPVREWVGKWVSEWVFNVTFPTIRATHTLFIVAAIYYIFIAKIIWFPLNCCLLFIWCNGFNTDEVVGQDILLHMWRRHCLSLLSFSSSFCSSFQPSLFFSIFFILLTISSFPISSLPPTSSILSSLYLFFLLSLSFPLFLYPSPSFTSFPSPCPYIHHPRNNRSLDAF